jgi:uncharacterized Zn finger protein
MTSYWQTLGRFCPKCSPRGRRARVRKELPVRGKVLTDNTEVLDYRCTRCGHAWTDWGRCP